jgi:hypothetical protein
MTVPELTKKMEKLKADCKPVPTAFDTVCTLASDKFPDGHELHYTFRVDFTRGLVPQQVRFVAFDFDSNRTFDDIKENLETQYGGVWLPRMFLNQQRYYIDLGDGYELGFRYTNMFEVDTGAPLRSYTLSLSKPALEKADDDAFEHPPPQPIPPFTEEDEK